MARRAVYGTDAENACGSAGADGGSAMRRFRYGVGRAGAAAMVLLGAVSALALAVGPPGADGQTGLAGQGAAPGRWLITTIAGGAGGPGPARRFAAGYCALTYAAGGIYAAGDSGVIRRVGVRTGSLSPVAGSGFADH